MSEELREINMENDDVTMETENSESGLLGKIVVGAVVAGAGLLGAVVYKNRGKLEERRIKKLEKKGYTVIKPEKVDDGSEKEVSEENEQ